MYWWLQRGFIQCFFIWKQWGWIVSPKAPSKWWNSELQFGPSSLLRALPLRSTEKTFKTKRNGASVRINGSSLSQEQEEEEDWPLPGLPAEGKNPWLVLKTKEYTNEVGTEETGVSSTSGHWFALYGQMTFCLPEYLWLLLVATFLIKDQIRFTWHGERCGVDVVESWEGGLLWDSSTNQAEGTREGLRGRRGRGGWNTRQGRLNLENMGKWSIEGQNVNVWIPLQSIISDPSSKKDIALSAKTLKCPLWIE